MNRFVYIIYNTKTYDIWEVHETEDECVRAFDERYDSYKNVDWMGSNLSYWFKHNFKL